MDENKKSIDGVLENLALLTDGMQTLFPEGKIICVYELNEQDFKRVQSNFRKIDSIHKRFNIDISGVEHVFIQEDSPKRFQKEEETPIKERKDLKRNIISKLLSSFKRS